jgi:DNA-binding response OmpR family regulator
MLSERRPVADSMSTKRPKILVVDDDAKTVSTISLYLRDAGYETIEAFDGRRALEAARSEAPDLLVLDLMLPGLDGRDVCRLLRAEASSVPIVMLTARTTEDDVLAGLDLGADDYLTKPFSPRELVARVRAVLRRAPSPAPEAAPPSLDYGGIALDARTREATAAGRPVRLTPAEFSLLAVLLRAPGRVFTRAELAERAFGWDYDGLERTVDAHVKNLRKKLGAATARIVTVYGVGYRLGEDADA